MSRVMVSFFLSGRVYVAEISGVGCGSGSLLSSFSFIALALSIMELILFCISSFLFSTLPSG